MLILLLLLDCLDWAPVASAAATVAVELCYCSCCFSVPADLAATNEDEPPPLPPLWLLGTAEPLLADYAPLPADAFLTGLLSYADCFSSLERKGLESFDGWGCAESDDKTLILTMFGAVYFFSSSWHFPFATGVALAYRVSLELDLAGTS